MNNLAITAALLFALSFVALPANAQTVKKWVDEDGVTHYSDQQPAEGEAEEIEVPDANVTEFDSQSAQERIEKKLEELEAERKAREQAAEQREKTEALEEALQREPLVSEEDKKKKKRKGIDYDGPYPMPIEERQRNCARTCRKTILPRATNPGVIPSSPASRG